LSEERLDGIQLAGKRPDARHLSARGAEARARGARARARGAWARARDASPARARGASPARARDASPARDGVFAVVVVIRDAV